MDVLFEDNHGIAVNKPAGLLTQADATGSPSLLEWVREDLRVRYHKPGNVFVGLVHRLDQPVSGVVLFARTSKAAARLSAQFRSGDIGKTYWAIVEGHIREENGAWTDWLLKNEQSNLVRVVPEGTPTARVAELDFQVRARWSRRRTWVELRPRTGRSHQLRVQLAGRGYPIVGDRKYGANSMLRASDGGPRIALHARELRFRHPTREEVICVTAGLPDDWPDER